MAVSFKLTSSSKPKELKKPAIEDVTTLTVDHDRDYVTSVSKNKIHGTKPEEKKKDVIIPCQKDGFKVALEEAFKDKDQSEAAAISALLKDAETFAGRGEDEHIAKTLVIPAVESARTVAADLGESNPISKQVAIGDAADYDAVSIDDFGMAMLRGMGFKESEGIGKTNKALVKPIEAHVRPRGQGLGAGVSRAKLAAAAAKERGEEQSRQYDDVEEVIELRAGVKCMILAGPHKEKYGIVDGLDAETSRVIVRLALGDKAISVPESNVKGVSEKEYKEFSRYLNKSSADAARKETEKKLMEMRTRSPETDKKSDKPRHRSRSPRNRSRSSERKNDRRDDRKSGSSHKSGGSYRKEEVPRWLSNYLSVIVKSGKYADQRGSITDVLTPTTCTIRLQNGKTLYDMESVDLIPVQPRRPGDPCMVLLGQNRRLVGEIVDIIEGKYAAIQSAADQLTVVTEKLSNLCVYTGSLDNF